MGFDDFEEFEKWDYIVGDDEQPPRQPASPTPPPKRGDESPTNIKQGIGCAILVILILVALFNL